MCIVSVVQNFGTWIFIEFKVTLKIKRVHWVPTNLQAANKFRELKTLGGAT